MQALCQCDAHEDESDELLQEFLIAREAAPNARTYATKIVAAFRATRDEIDAKIVAVTKNWDLSRISTVERNILRVAAIEMSATLVPPKVAINEAIEIGREFGGEATPRFINGVLDGLLKSGQIPKEGSD